MDADLDDTVELAQVHEDFKPTTKLSRCTSTPLVTTQKSKLFDQFLFKSPPPNVQNVTADSGFVSSEIDSSLDKSQNSIEGTSQDFRDLRHRSKNRKIVDKSQNLIEDSTQNCDVSDLRLSKNRKILDSSQNMIENSPQNCDFRDLRSCSKNRKIMDKSLMVEVSTQNCDIRDFQSNNRRILENTSQNSIEITQNCDLRSSKNRRILYLPGHFLNYSTLDFIKRLHDRHMVMIIGQIWSYLSPQDLGRVLQVSQLWKNCVENDKIAFEKYSHAKKIYNENSKTDGHICSRLRNKSGQSARKALKPITNCLLSPVKSRPPMTQRRSPRLAKISPLKNGNKEDSGIYTPSKYRHKLFTEV